MTRHTARRATFEHYRLAEGPVWDPVRERLLWVDIEAGLVVDGVFDGSSIRPIEARPIDGTVGALACAEDGTLLIAGTRDLVTLRSDGEILDVTPVLPPDRPSRLNDGACDPGGRFLVGSMAQDDRTGVELLVRREDGGAITVVDDDLTVSNGLAWSPDGTTFYSVDSGPGTIWARDYDAATGEVGPRRPFLTIEDGTPDGMCADADGNLWIAIFGAGEVRCHAPGGALLATVAVPGAPHVTSVAFAGSDLDTLVITTARHELSPAELDQNPDSGRLFVADVGNVGAPVPLWRGPG